MELCDHLPAVASIFLISAALEGLAVKAAYGEILSLSKKEQVKGVATGDVGANSPGGTSEAGAASDGGKSRKVFRYLREGRDVMSVATFTESSSGIVGSVLGIVGLSASWFFQSGTPDVIASMFMGCLVCGVSGFLLNKSGTALLGQTLPRWRVQGLISCLEAHAAVVNVYDVKTEMIGTDTVRFKAEVQFNPQSITERILNTGSVAEDRTTLHLGPSVAAHDALGQRLQEMLPQLHQGVPPSIPSALEPNIDQDADNWLYSNNGLFYEALAWELKDVERVLRDELSDFKNVHIDLEPW